MDWRDLFSDNAETGWGWQASHNTLMTQGQQEEATALLDVVLQVDPDNLAAQSLARATPLGEMPLQVWPLFLGFLSAFISGYVVIKWLIN